MEVENISLRSTSVSEQPVKTSRDIRAASGVKTLLRQRKNMLFSYFVISLFELWSVMMIVCEGTRRPRLQERSCAANAAGCADVRVSASCGFLHIGFQCAMCCFWGKVPQLQMWNFNLIFFVVVTLTSLSKCGWWSLLERWLFQQEVGSYELVYLSPAQSITAFPLEVTACSNASANLRPKRWCADLLRRCFSSDC